VLFVVSGAIVAVVLVPARLCVVPLVTVESGHREQTRVAAIAWLGF